MNSVATGRQLILSLFRFYRYAIIDSIAIVRAHGFRELIRRRGMKLVVAVVAYYLIRDTLIYLVIPYCIARGIL